MEAQEELYYRIIHTFSFLIGRLGPEKAKEFSEDLIVALSVMPIDADLLHAIFSDADLLGEIEETVHEVRAGDVG